MEISSSIQNTYVNQSYTQAAKETTQKLTSKDNQKDTDTIVALGKSTEKVTYDRPKGLSSEQDVYKRQQYGKCCEYRYTTRLFRNAGRHLN